MKTVKAHREPLVRIVKRDGISLWKNWLIRLAAVLVALLLSGLFIYAVTKLNPIDVYVSMFEGAFGTSRRIRITIRDAMMLLCIGVGLAPAFKMRFWNIGGEGQLIMGGVFASFFALFCTDWPHPLLLAVMFVAGAIGGGLWGLVPAVFKSRWNTNETLFTLMLNYIALHIVSWLQSGPWRDEGANGFNKIARFDKNAGLDKVLGVHFGWIIMLVLVVLVWVYLKYTKHGYEISVVGESQDTARYAGIHVKKVVLRTMFLSGAIAGIAGVCQVGGSDMTLSMGVAGGVGFTAIIVAWLCQLNPGMILVVSFLFSVLEKGSGVVQSEFGLSADSADVLQGVILFFILASEFFVRYGFAVRKKQPKGGA